MTKAHSDAAKRRYQQEAETICSTWIDEGEGGGLLLSTKREISIGYVQLMAVVIRRGLESEGPGYALTPGGTFWCWLGNVWPDYVWKEASRSDHGARHESELPRKEVMAVS